MGISCDSRHLNEPDWTLHSFITCISKIKYATRTDEWHTTWISPHLPSLGVDTEKDFFQWFLHFIKHTKLTKEEPVILVLDGHYSHTSNLEVIALARENNVDIICLPPHCSHKMQPLDKAFMGPLTTFYCQEMEKWLHSHPGQVIIMYQTGKLFGNAYKRAAMDEIVVNGFRATGFFPCDKNILRPYDFPVLRRHTCCSCEPPCFDKYQ
jgi:hypothetical protein